VRFSLHDDTLPPDAAALVDQGIGDFNDRAAPLHEVRALGCFVHTGDDTVLGGAVGRTWGACAELEQLWLPPEHRGTGLGSELLRRFEARAAERGCTLIYLVTYSFQAPEFYKRHGYAAVHGVAGYGHGIVRWHMEKQLGAPAAQVQP
jgi:GNAT superfamily N-acetyltransferase